MLLHYFLFFSSNTSPLSLLRLFLEFMEILCGSERLVYRISSFFSSAIPFISLIISSQNLPILWFTFSIAPMGLVVKRFISAWSHLEGGFSDTLPVKWSYHNFDLLKNSII